MQEKTVIHVQSCEARVRARIFHTYVLLFYYLSGPDVNLLPTEIYFCNADRTMHCTKSEKICSCIYLNIYRIQKLLK
jgi:hypothetical protein